MQRSNKFKWNRILKLADFMDKLPRSKFNFRHFVGDMWGGAQDLSCGTTACALGWAPSVPVFRRLGVRLEREPQSGTPAVSFQGHFSLKGLGWDKFAEDLFYVTSETMNVLFLPSHPFLSYGQGRLPETITPKQWARHARGIVKALKAGKIKPPVELE